MKLRILAIAAAVSFTSPALSATSDLDPLGTLKPATAAPAATTTTTAPVVKKKVAKKPVKKTTVAKKTVKKTTVAKKEVAPAPEKPKGLFASLFGAPSEAQAPQLKTGKSKELKAKEKELAALKAKKAAAKDIKAKEKELAALKAKEAKAREKELALFKAKEAKAKELAALKAKEAKDAKTKELAAAKSKDAAKGKKPEGTQVASTDAPDSFRFGLFGQSSSSVSSSNFDTLALDDAMREQDSKKKFKVKDEFKPSIVPFPGDYKRGTIVVKTDERRLYLVEGGGMARRYPIAVGKEGLQFAGKGTIGDMQEWPRWIPTKEMVERDPKKYAQYDEVGMDGGPTNPLGARAIYLYQGETDTHIRVHGTVAPGTIGTAASNGCFRMFNEQVIDLYGRVKMGAEFIVL